jgi:hypothetical protein
MKFLGTDAGIFTDIAASLADGGKNEVILTSPWQTVYPQRKDHAPGVGIKGLKKEDAHGNPLLFWDHVADADCIFNFDVGANDQIAFLRKLYPKKSTWGSGKGERIEADRIFLKKLIDALDLDQVPHVIIKGVTALKQHIKKNPNKYVKINLWRGDMESFHAVSEEDNRADFLKLELTLGPNAESTLFIVEDMIKAKAEIGYDGFFAGTDYADKCFCGIECAKNLYIAKVFDYDELPTPIHDTMEALAPVLEKVDYRGAISTEERMVSLKEHYLIDVCSRLPSPLSALYPEFINNWPEFVYQTGLGKACPLDIDVKYVGAFALSSMRGKDEYLPIKVKESDRDKIKFQSVTMHDGKYSGVKGNEIIATIVAGGDSKEEVLNKIKEYSKLVDAPGLDNDAVNGIDKILEQFDELGGIGITI